MEVHERLEVAHLVVKMCDRQIVTTGDARSMIESLHLLPASIPGASRKAFLDFMRGLASDNTVPGSVRDHASRFLVDTEGA